MRSVFSLVFTAALTLFFSCVAEGQSYSFNYRFNYEAVRADQPIRVSELPFEMPENARKNGADGTVVVTAVFGGNGKVREVLVIQDPGGGVGDAAKIAVEQVTYTPASFEGKPVDVKATITFDIAAVYSEGDQAVSAVKITGKPTAAYPEKFRSEKRKGQVSIWATFHPDGRIKVHDVDSTMPPEFDEAAKLAAADLKFQPATHKKSKRPVAQAIWVIFDFKP